MSALAGGSQELGSRVVDEQFLLVVGVRVIRVDRVLEVVEDELHGERVHQGLLDDLGARAEFGRPRVGRRERLGHDVIDPGETAVTVAAGERRVRGALAREIRETLQPQLSYFASMSADAAPLVRSALISAIASENWSDAPTSLVNVYVTPLAV